VSESSTPAAALARPFAAWSARRRSIAIEGASFALVAAVYVVQLLRSGYDRFYYDADEYWRLGDQFGHGTDFSLRAYSYDWRGYSMPLATHVLNGMGSLLGVSDMTIVRLFGALLATTLGVIVAPRFARALFPAAAITPARVLALNGLLFLYWRDHFGFPLVDFPSLLCACVGVLALLHRRPLGYVAAGLCLGFAANLRANYGFALLAAIAVAALASRDQASDKSSLSRRARHGRVLAAALVVAGALIAVFPQSLINHHQRGSWSPTIDKADEQTLVSIWVGMTAQKYETYVGPASEYPEPGVSYLDPATTRLLAQEGIRPVITASNHVAFPGDREYLKLLAKHPLEMSASYARHVFNGLDVKYPTPYVRDLRDTSPVTSLLEYTLIFLALARLLVPGARRALGAVRWSGLLVLVAACIGVLQVQAEVRYFLPLQLPIYLLACFGPATRATLFAGRERRVTLALAYAAFVLLCLTLSSSTTAQLEHPIADGGAPSAAG
jgi:hypothetical protein